MAWYLLAAPLSLGFMGAEAQRPPGIHLEGEPAEDEEKYSLRLRER